MKKLLISLILALALAFSLASCDSCDKSDNPTGDSTPQTGTGTGGPFDGVEFPWEDLENIQSQSKK